MRRVPRYIADDRRLDVLRNLSTNDAIEAVRSHWTSMQHLQLGPGPIGTTEIPIEAQYIKWLVYERPDSEQAVLKLTNDENVIVRGYAIATLLEMGSRLVLDLPASVTTCRTPITRGNGCSIVTVPFKEIFCDEIDQMALSFGGPNANRPSGWWLDDDESD